VFLDGNKNGQDDGQETQANLYQAFFNVLNSHPGTVNGPFLWDTAMVASDALWAQTDGPRCTFTVRDKLAEEVVRPAYATYEK
jgi:hypothetical protein